MEETKKIQWPGWKTVRLIGRGSYGAVYEIERDLFGKKEKAALKHIGIPQNPSDIEEMYSDGYDEESITASFQSHLESIVAEYSLMRKLNGAANVVNCDDVKYVQREDGIGWDIYIKMELLTPLTQALPNPIPEEVVIKLAEDMCQALVLCKRFNIVHRDIKPMNIFVSSLGDYKLGDFGIAKTVEKTMGGTKTGTYKYMAPEVYNNQPYGQQADIYSLGLVLYWMLNKKRMPFLPLPPAKLTAGMDEQALNRRLSGELLPPPAGGSEDLKRIVLRACAYDPKNRYRSAEEMLLELNGIEVHPSSEERRVSAVGSGSAQEDDSTVVAFKAPAQSAPSETLDDERTASVLPDSHNGGRVSAARSFVDQDGDKTVGGFNTKPPTPQNYNTPEQKLHGSKTVESGAARIPDEQKSTEQRQTDVRPVHKMKTWWLIAGAFAIGVLVFGIISVLSGKAANDPPIDTRLNTTQAFHTQTDSAHTMPTKNEPDSSEAVHGLPAPEPGIHTYEFVQDNCTWEEALEKAAQRNGHLVCFETQEECEYVLHLMEEEAPELYYMRVGARRDIDGTEYHWVNQNNQFFGAPINSLDSWCVSFWDDGEPTLSWKGNQEYYCVVSYNWDKQKWVLNDIGDAVSEELNQNMIGFIVEFEPT